MDETSPLRALTCGCALYTDHLGSRTRFPCGAHADERDVADDVPALSILQPWADAILTGAKRVENRTWHTRRRGLVAVHAGKGWDGEAPDERGGDDYVSWACREVGAAPPSFRLAAGRRGGLLGLVDLTACVRDGDVPEGQGPWANGPWCFVFAPTALAFSRPVPWRGERGFFSVPAREIADAVRGAVAWSALAAIPTFSPPAVARTTKTGAPSGVVRLGLGLEA